ncbi:MAG: hypothetical protein RR980_01120 [Mucinivorans sp.]
MKKKISKILKCLLIALFVSYYAESTLFFHTHTFAWGTVTHSHPYMPSAAHSHTASECQTIQSLTTLLFIIAGTAFAALLLHVVTLLYSAALHACVILPVEHTALRGPPLSIC